VLIEAAFTGRTSTAEKPIWRRFEDTYWILAFFRESEALLDFSFGILAISFFSVVLKVFLIIPSSSAVKIVFLFHTNRSLNAVLGLTNFVGYLTFLDFSN